MTDSLDLSQGSDRRTFKRLYRRYTREYITQLGLQGWDVRVHFDQAGAKDLGIVCPECEEDGGRLGPELGATTRADPRYLRASVHVQVDDKLTPLPSLRNLVAHEVSHVFTAEVNTFVHRLIGELGVKGGTLVDEAWSDILECLCERIARKLVAAPPG